MTSSPQSADCTLHSRTPALASGKATAAQDPSPESTVWEPRARIQNAVSEPQSWDDAQGVLCSTVKGHVQAGREPTASVGAAEPGGAFPASCWPRSGQAHAGHWHSPWENLTALSGAK